MTITCGAVSRTKEFLLLVWFSCAGFYLPGLVFMKQPVQRSLPAGGQAKRGFFWNLLRDCRESDAAAGERPSANVSEIICPAPRSEPWCFCPPQRGLGEAGFFAPRAVVVAPAPRRPGRAPAGLVGALHVALLISPNPGVSRGPCAQLSAGLYKLRSW